MRVEVPVEHQANPNGARPVAQPVTMVHGFAMVDLSSLADNRAISSAAALGTGAMNVWGNSLPAEDLPAPGTTLSRELVPFQLVAASAAGDNVRCSGQYVSVPCGRYDWVHLLAAAERRTEDTVAMHFVSGAVDFEPLRVSDFWTGAPAWFGEAQALHTPFMHYRRHVQPQMPAQLWSQRVAVTRRDDLIGLRLPHNVAIHVFALTLQTVHEEHR